LNWWPEPDNPNAPLDTSNGLSKEQCLNLGCGRRTFPRMTNVDKWDGPGIDQVVDLFSLPLPWDDDSFLYLYGGHFFEHIPHQWGGYTEFWFPFIKEIIRILAPGATMEIVGPHPRKLDYLECPGHCRQVSQISFNPFRLRDFERMSNQINEIDKRKSLEFIDQRDYRYFQLGPLSSYHFRKYLRMEVGAIHGIRLRYRVVNTLNFFVEDDTE